jgi:hypothetical protein
MVEASKISQPWQCCSGENRESYDGWRECGLRTTFGPKSPSMTGDSAVEAGDSAGDATRIDLRGAHIALQSEIPNSI